MKKKVRPSLEKIKPYVPGKNPDQPDVIKLASNENPFGPSPKALETFKKFSKDMSIYPDQHCIQLREAISKKINISPNNLIVGNGSDEVMQFVCAAFLNAKEEALIANNAFSTYEFVTRIFDGNPIFVDLKNYAYDLDAMAKAVSLSTKIIFICNPNNPTGSFIRKKDLDAFIKSVPKGIIVVIDEAYADYVEDRDFPDSLKFVKEEKDVVVLRTFSKIYGLAGIRVGYGIAKPELIKYLYLTKLPFNVNRAAQVAAAAALGDIAFVEKSRANNHLGKKYLYNELAKLKLEFQKTEANFIFMTLNKPADEVFIELMRQGVIVRPLTSFGFPESIRVTIGTPEQNQKFIEALKAVL